MIDTRRRRGGAMEVNATYYSLKVKEFVNHPNLCNTIFHNLRDFTKTTKIRTFFSVHFIFSHCGIKICRRKYLRRMMGISRNFVFTEVDTYYLQLYGVPIRVKSIKYITFYILKPKKPCGPFISTYII